MDRGKDRPAAEGRRRATAAQQRLVYVVVENSAKPIAIFAAQGPRKRFGHRIANSIGVTQALSLDDLYRLVNELQR